MTAVSFYSVQLIYISGAHGYAMNYESVLSHALRCKFVSPACQLGPFLL